MTIGMPIGMIISIVRFLPSVLAQAHTVRLIKERPLAKDSSPLPFSFLGIVSTGDSAVDDDTIVPKSHASGLPFPAHREIVCRVNVPRDTQYSLVSSHRDVPTLSGSPGCAVPQLPSDPLDGAQKMDYRKVT